ncbi:unnamed protein product [Cunninghamella blakesleeana]
MSDERPAKRGKRLKPCQRCKTQRRKCERESPDESCTRCIKSNRECINDNGNLENNDDAIDGTPEIHYLTEQVVQLQQSLNQVESYLQNNQLKTTAEIDNITNLLNQMTNKENIDSNNDNKTTINHRHHHHHHHHHDYDHNNTHDQTVSLYSIPNSEDYYITDGVNNLALSSSSLSSYSHSVLTSVLSPNLSLLSTGAEENIYNNDNDNDNDNDNRTNYNWDLTLVNGKLTLDNPIKSVEELVAYGKAFNRYLSPFSGAFNNTSFLFENNQPESLICIALDAISLTDLRSLKKNNPYKMIMNSNTHDRLFDQHGFPHTYIVEEMLALYFTCLNPGLPMIHAPSYWAIYDRDVRPNPFKHGITMAICTMVCSSSCKHCKYVAHEKRLLCEFFFERAQDILYDIFDDPDKKLETVIIINFITNYYRFTLRISEARKWCSISYLLCKDLKNEYSIPLITSLKKDAFSSSLSNVSSPEMSSSESVSSSSTSSTSSTSSSSSSLPYNTTLTLSTSNINRALFSRHYAAAVAQEKFINFIVDHDHSVDEYLTSIPMLIVEDEGETTAIFLEIYNRLLQLVINPIILEWTEQLHKMLIGKPAEFSLELILRFDQAYSDWWKSVPSHFRICDEDPSDIKCRKYIDDCYDEYKLLLFSILLAHKAESYIALVRPSNQSTVSSDGSYALLRAIQDRALNSAFECCETMVMAVRKLQLVKDYCLFTSDFLITIADLLSSLVESNDETIAQKSKEKLKITLTELEHGYFMEGSIVSPTSSPLQHFKILKETTTKDNFLNLFDMYNNYASPILAFSYDILKHSIKEKKNR